MKKCKILDFATGDMNKKDLGVYYVSKIVGEQHVYSWPDVERVLDKYLEAGWQVKQIGRNGTVFYLEWEK